MFILNVPIYIYTVSCIVIWNDHRTKTKSNTYYRPQPQPLIETFWCTCVELWLCYTFVVAYFVRKLAHEWNRWRHSRLWMSCIYCFFFFGFDFLVHIHKTMAIRLGHHWALKVREHVCRQIQHKLYVYLYTIMIGCVYVRMPAGEYNVYEQGTMTIFAIAIFNSKWIYWPNNRIQYNRKAFGHFRTRLFYNIIYDDWFTLIPN